MVSSASRLLRRYLGSSVLKITGDSIVPLVALAFGTWAVFVFQPFGERFTAFTVIAGIAGSIVVGPRIASALGAVTRTASLSGVGRSLCFGRRTLIGALACWLALIAWSGLSAGGATPPRKSDPRAIRVVTWNILHGQDHGAPWTRWGWPARKKALHAALTSTQPEILCVQEALAEQVDSIAAMLPEHEHVGVGRDDGRAAGEHCAIFYDARRFAEDDSGTFWLEEPTGEPPTGLRLGPKRICTWVRLCERSSGRFLRVYNAHLYLTEKARRRAARVILEQIAEGNPDDALLVMGDFNATPKAASRLLFEKTGLLSAVAVAGGSRPPATYHFYGIRLRNLDEIFCSPNCKVSEVRVLDVKPGNTYPSDHFGVLADVVPNR
jgi:endonuclease/exonuclease/phosphatase family metal-dependent hydrolase